MDTYEELHLGNLLIDLLHELDDEVDELVLQQLLGVEVCDQEGNVVALPQLAPPPLPTILSILPPSIGGPRRFQATKTGQRTPQYMHAP